MNLFFKSYKYCLIFFLLISCESGIIRGIAQDHNLYLTPWIQEIILPSPNHEIPNETFYRNHRGTLFIGKGNGLTIVAGQEMSHLNMEGPVFVEGDDSDTLFYAAQNDLGFLVRQQNHIYRKISRVHLLSPSQRNISPTGFAGEGDLMLLYSNNGIYRISRTEIEFLKDQKAQNPQPGTDAVIEKELVRLLEDHTGLTLKGIRQVSKRGTTETWILGAYSLYRMIHPPPLSVMETGALVPGRILNSQVSGRRILLGTTQGMYSIEQNRKLSNQWRVTDLHVEDYSPVKLLQSAYNQTIAAGPDGLYLLRGSQCITIDKGSFTGIRIIRQESLLASSNRGLVRYDQRGSAWKMSIIDPSLTNAHSFLEYRNQVFFLCKNGVFRINRRAARAQPIQFQSGEVLFRMVMLERELLLVGSQQVYRYDEAEEIFHPLPASQKTKFLSESGLIIPVSQDDYWILKDQGSDRSKVVHTTSLDEPDAEHASLPVLQILGDIVTLSYHDSILYFTGRDKISLFNLRSLRNTRLMDRIQINQAQVTRDAIGFRFTSLELQNNPEPLFRQRILPDNELWSEWHKGRSYTVSGLKPGTYTIEAEAMDLYGRISEPGQLIFSVDTPLYASWFAYVLYALLFLVGLFLIRKWRLLGNMRAESRISARIESKIQSLHLENEESGKLVAEILPKVSASQIKSRGKSKWDKYERATVLFSDIQGFTKIAEEMNPEALIDELDTFFFRFDSVVEKYNIEKIKTIGDAYMAAGGIPHKNSTNPVEVVLAALEMQSYMKDLKSSRANIWDLRIGIHTGPVIAGVVGHKKVSYDIWGDTVNTASRMESSGMAGKINISSITYGMVKEYFLCEYRGKLPVKYKGNIDMYFVTGLRPELSVDLKELPNKRFFVKLQILRLGDLEDRVFNQVLAELPESLHFHRLEYAKKVYMQSFLLCRSEEIEQEDRLLVRTAALLLYTGLTQAYQNFENRSTVICREILPDFAYSETQIEQICKLILAAKMPFSPSNRLETILIDARMEFIGRPDYTDQMKLLYREMKEAGAKINGQQFKKQQFELLYNFEFNTLAARRLREVSGPDQMSILEQERWI
jgi:adenylate cyclase